MGKPFIRPPDGSDDVGRPYDCCPCLCGGGLANADDGAEVDSLPGDIVVFLRAGHQKRMAWVAMGSMIVFSGALFTPFVSESRVAALADLLGLFYIAQAGVVGAYMGVSAWMSRK